MKNVKFDVRNTYAEALELASNCKRLMFILNGNEGNFLIADLTNANRLIKRGFKMASKEFA